MVPGGQVGGIFNDTGQLTLASSTLSGNSATTAGGGIENGGVSGMLMVKNSTLKDNVTLYGGGIYNDGATGIVTNSTLDNNTATNYGGGIYNDGSAMLTMTDSTLSNNTASTGGGIYNNSNERITLTYATVVANSSGLSGLLLVTGTLVANSTSGPNCSGPATEVQGDNLDSGTTCGFSQTTDLTNTNPLLGVAPIEWRVQR